MALLTYTNVTLMVDNDVTALVSVFLGTRPLSLSVCVVINYQIDLGDVTAMNSAR